MSEKTNRKRYDHFRPSVRMAIGVVVGIVILCIGSFIQKKLIGVDPYVLVDYLFPALFGGLVGGAVVYMMNQITRLLTAKLQLEEQVRRSLEQAIATHTVELAHAYEKMQTEVAERKRIEEALRKLTSAVEQNPASIVITDLTGAIEYVNPKFTDLTGYTPEEVLGKNPRILKSGRTSREEYDVLWQTIKSGGEWRGEFLNKKRNGEHYWESALISSIKDEAGNTTHYLAIKEDITEHKHTEMLLKSNLQFLQTLIDTIPNPVFYKDVDGVFLGCNRVFAQEILGVPDKEIVNTSIADLFHSISHDSTAIYGDESELIAEQGTQISETSIVTADGTKRDYVLYKAAFFGSDSKAAGIISVMLDVTALKQAEAHKLRLALEHERLTLLGGFVLAVSHDFRTSLTNIELSRDLIGRLLGDAERDKVQSRLDNIKRYVHHLVEQLDSFETVSALAGMTTEPCNLNSVVQNIVKKNESAAQDKQQVLTFEADPALPSIRGNAQELGRAVDKLVVNALSFTPAGGKITLRTYQNENTVALEVRDTGIGIPPEQQSAIFDFFFRADEARSLSTGGVGLGLSIARVVTEAHGGSITVESEPGKGSVFTLALPIDRSDNKRF